MEVTEARELRSAGGEPDDETMAAKKRSRRVSFAETTAVHVFDRDEDLDTPSEPGVEASSLRWGDHSESDDDSKSSAQDDEDDDEEGEQVLFVRDMDSSSPGSAVGSVTSNDDDDNFFGPVSASFISSGRLSEGGMSDDNNHDITLDSTAFSLHFRNIAPPPDQDRTANSVGSIRTPTGETMPAGPRSKISGSASDSNSTTMSLIVDNPDRYDYGRISPTLEALLAEVDRSIRPSSPNGVKESGKYEAPFGDRAVSDDKADDSCLVGGRINSGNTTHDAQVTPCIDTSTDDRTKDAGHLMVKDYCKDDHKATQSDIVAASAQSSDLLLTPFRKSQSNLIVKSDIIHQSSLTNEGHVSKYHSNFSSGSAPSPSAQEMMVIDGQQRMESEYGTHTPKNAVQTFHSPLQGCVSSIHAKRQHLFLDHTVLPQTRLIQSPTREQPPSSLKMEITGRSEKISAIKSRVSKFKIPETPILVSSIPALSGEDHMLHDYEGNLDKINKTMDNHKTKDMVTSANSIEEYLMNTFQTAGEYQTSVVSNHSGCKTPTHSEKNKVIGESVKLTDTISTLQFSTSKINVNLDSLTSYNPIDLASSPNANGSSQIPTSVEHKKNSQDYCTPGAGGTIRSSSLLKNRLPSLTSFPTPISNDLRRLQSLNELANNSNDTILYNSQEIQSSSDFHLRSQDVNTAIKTGRTNVREKLSEREMLASSYEPTCGDAYKQAAIAGKSEIFADTVRRIDKETVNLSDKNILDSFCLMDTMPPISTQDPRLHGCDINCQDPFSLRESFSAQDVDIVGRKRKIEHNLLKEKHLINEICRAQKNPKLLTKVIDNIPESSSGHHVDRNNEATDIGAQPTLKHWTDIFFKVSEATKAQFSPIYKLTLKEIDLLEVILGELQTTRKYERLYTSLRNNECFSHPYQHRIAEARLLQDKLVFEQAKLQLKRMKLDLLCNKSQLSQSRVRECHKLKSLFSQLICVPRSSQTHGTWLHSDSINPNDQNQKEQNKVASMKQELEILEQKARCLVKTFEASCKIKGNIDCDGIIKIVNENLEMRSHRRVIRQDLQLWELGDIMKKNDQSEIVLNYHNFLCQRFTINIDQVSSIVISNLSNDANIEKNFPNMNAFIAFEFVFKAKGARRLASSKCFQQETLVTNLLLGNLLDVLKEVQVSRRELWNLICSDFHSQCSGQLELQLCFVNLKSGRKVTLGLDMTDLDCAIYPSKPSELQYRIIPGTLTTLLPSVMDEIVNSIPSLQDGRPMILRLCRHISDVVQASG